MTATRSRAFRSGRGMPDLHVLQALEDGQREPVARRRTGDRIARRTLSQEARSEGLTQGTLPVGIGFRIGRRISMKRGDGGDDVRLYRMDRGRPGGHDSESRHHESGDRCHSLFLRENIGSGAGLDARHLASTREIGIHAALQ